MLDAFAQEIDIGNEKIVADQLHFVSERVGQFFPAGPVILGEAVLDRDDRVFGAELLVVSDHLVSRADFTVGLFEDVSLLGLVVEFARGAIEGDEDLFAEFVAGLFDCRGNGVEGVLGRGEIRGETAFVTHAGGETAALEHGLEGVENFATAAQGLAEGGEPARHDHEFLEVNRGIGVRAAVDDIHHWHGENFGVRAAEVFEEGLAELRRRGMGGGH